MENLDLKNKKVAVLGIGTEGLALVDFLIDKGGKISVLDKLKEQELLENGIDSEKIKEIIADEKIEKIFGENYLDNLKDYDLIFRSPGIPFLNPKIQEAILAGVEVSSQIKLFFDLCPCQIVGITGTKGKGTTASLIFEILKEKFQNSGSNIYLAGNIGYPAITLIPKLKPEDIVILELSSFQLIDLEKSPHIAAITNLTVDHLDYHKDISEYQRAKFNILKYQKNGDIAILNKNSTFNSENLAEVRSEKKYFSGDKNGDAEIIKVDEDFKVILKESGKEIEICALSEIKLFGIHNLENIAAAALTARTLKIDSKIISDVVKKFTGLPHRLEFVAEIKNVKFVNDSFATNPDPTMAAIKSFSQNKILILGGSSKGADFSELLDEIIKSNVSGVVLIGIEGEKIKTILKERKFSGQIIDGGKTMPEIVNSAFNISKKYEVIILSPACASFGLFKNYKDRGEKFKKAVLELEAENLSK